MKRRTFLKRAGLAGTAALGANLLPGPWVLTGRSQGKADGSPNILVILVDQLRFPQGLFNQQQMDEVAPNLARLRRQSVSFSNFFNVSNACSPSRAALLTGLYTHQNGMFLTNTQGGFGTPPTPDLNPGFPTWGTILKSFNYKTYWWGKWHLSANDQTDCDFTPYGFDGNLPCPSPNGMPGQGLAADPPIADLFIDWLGTSGDNGPWCTTVSLVNPHDVQFFPKYSQNVAGENALPQYFSSLPPNFETPLQSLAQGKPAVQRQFILTTDVLFGLMRYQGEGFAQQWFDLMNLYALVTSYVDEQIGRVLDALEARPDIAERTMVIATADHGEYGGSHGLRGKGAAAYEEAIRLPLYVRDPSGKIARGAGTNRPQLCSSVDIVPLLTTLATGGDSWRRLPQFAHLAERLDLTDILRNPHAPGRPYIIHATDEEIIEEGPRIGMAGAAHFSENVPQHVIALRTPRAKVVTCSFWKSGSIELELERQDLECYDYSSAEGQLELTNVAPSNPQPELRQRGLFTELYHRLFHEAIPHELRRPLPPSLRPVYEEAIADYLAYKAITP